ncbi:MAG: diguanylate cyclase [Pseudomonadota bacterium]
MDDWVKELPSAITVAEEDGTISRMNDRSVETFANDGGTALIGQNVFDCHEGPAKEKTLELFRTRQSNHYTIRKNGQKKIIHQIPWYKKGRFAGFVELSIPIPDDLPHFDRS